MNEQENSRWYSQEPLSPQEPERREPEFDRKGARRVFSRIGWAFSVLLGVTALAQLAGVWAIQRFFPEFISSPWYLWTLSLIPMYILATPLCLLCAGGMERFAPERSSMSVKGFFVCFVMSLGLMYALNMGTNLLLTLIDELIGTQLVNPLAEVLEQSGVWQTVLFAVVIAPVLEELLFRKLLVDRLLKYGERTAILASGIVFGLYHANLSQFFYAVGLGMLFAFIYIRTGRVRHTILLHMGVNFFGSVPAMLLTEYLDPSILEGLTEQNWETVAANLPQVAVYAVYVVFILAVALTGVSLLLKRAGAFRARVTGRELPAGQGFFVACLNSGMLVYFLVCAALFSLTFISV